MEIVDVEPLDRWGWECPGCEEWNEEEDDPNCQETVVCLGCAREFKPEVQG